MSKFRKQMSRLQSKRNFSRHADHGQRAKLVTTPSVTFVKRLGKRM